MLEPATGGAHFLAADESFGASDGERVASDAHGAIDESRGVLAAVGRCEACDFGDVG